MTTRLLGIQIDPDLHGAVHATARMNGKTLTDWLIPILLQNLDPKAAALFLSDSAHQTDQLQSEPQLPAA